MFRFVTVFALVSCTFAGTLPNDFGGLIMDGTDTTIEEHPYQVSMQKNFDIKFCGGAIISPDTIVTAGHCVYKRNSSDFKIRLGSTKYNSGGELVEIRAFRSHEQYNVTSDLNDIGIIKLARPVRESDTVRFVKLATQTPKAGTSAVITGWGIVCYGGCDGYPATLQQVEFKIVGDKECADMNGFEIHPSMLCAYAISEYTCVGDSGGPLVAESKLVGVVSWGYGCAVEGHPGMYADVAYYRNWILATANSL